MSPNFSIVQPRAEGELVPEGISLTISMLANYIYIKVGDVKVCVRVPKDGVIQNVQVTVEMGAKEDALLKPKGNPKRKDMATL
jgi:hypothetical protein